MVWCTEQKTRRLVSTSGLQLLSSWYLGLQVSSAFFTDEQNVSVRLSSLSGII